MVHRPPLALFDNGNLRLDPSGTVACNSSSTAAACYSRTIVLQIDEEARVANFALGIPPRLLLPVGRHVPRFHRTAMLNLTPRFRFLGWLRRFTEIRAETDDQIVWQMNVTGQNTYRGARIPSLYPGITWQK